MTVVFVARDAEGIDHWGEGEGGEEEGKILDGLYLKRYFLQFLGWATALRPGRPGTKTLAASAAAVVGRSTMSSRVVPRPPRRRGGGGETRCQGAGRGGRRRRHVGRRGRAVDWALSQHASVLPPPAAPTDGIPPRGPADTTGRRLCCHPWPPAIGHPPRAAGRRRPAAWVPRYPRVASRVSTNKRADLAHEAGGARGDGGATALAPPSLPPPRPRRPSRPPSWRGVCRGARALRWRATASRQRAQSPARWP